MSMFSRKERKEFFSSLENDVTQGFMEAEEIKIKHEETNPDTLTKEEILFGVDNSEVKPTEISDCSPLEALKRRMLDNNNVKPQQPIPVAQNPIVRETEETVSKVSAEKPKITESGFVFEEPIEPVKPIAHKPKHQTHTLLQKCKPYTLDEEGNDISDNEHPLYKLESVAEILRSDSEAALKELSEKYNFTLKGDDGKEKVNSSIKPQTESSDEKVEDEKTDSSENELAKTIQIPIISDIDNTSVPLNESQTVPINNGATIKFTPVKDEIGNTNSISVSSITKQIDIKAELEDFEKSEQESIETTKLELTEFEEFEAANEYTDVSKSRAFLIKLAKRKRNAFLLTVLSFLMSLAISVFLIGGLNSLLIKETRTVLITCAAFFFVNIVSQYDIFISFSKFNSKHISSDVICGISVLISLAFSISAISSDMSDSYYLILLSSLNLTARSICKFLDCSTMLGNFKKISANKPKKVVAFISDNSTTYSMAKNSIEGDVLIAAPRHTDFVSDFIKYSTYGVKLNGKLRIITVISFCFAVLTAVLSGTFYGSFHHALFGASAIMCFASLPALMFIDSLPSAFAAFRLHKKGAMIAGKAGAGKIETANAAVISTADIFPSGTITLQSMKVLSENSIDDTILRAASLTEAVDSTLAPIFKQIAGTSSSYSMPNSDTVKYESKLGLSGWVADELLFIGNRTLMEAHGIAVPSIELDRKILRQGFFPVYLASGGKACAMIVIQYNVDAEIAKELKRITELGVTLLINNSDPNINEEMLSDYFGIYDDYIKILDNVGMRMYKNANVDMEKCSSPSVFSGSNLNLISVMNCASRIRKSNLLLSILYIAFSIVLTVIFVYTSFSGGEASMLSAKSILISESTAGVISFLAFLIKKP